MPLGENLHLIRSPARVHRHPERSEVSQSPMNEILHFVQDN